MGKFPWSEIDTTFKTGLGPLDRDATIVMDGVRYLLRSGNTAELTVTEAKPKKIDIDRLRVDREYWDQMSPSGATHYSPDLGLSWLRDQPLGYYCVSELRWIDYTDETLGRDHVNSAIPRPPEDREANKVGELPRMAIMVNPHEARLQYGMEHLGREIEALEYIADENCYVVRFDWGLGVLDGSMVDFGLWDKRDEEQREREELFEVIKSSTIHTPTDGIIYRMVDAVIAAGYRRR